jgi:signal transduction histidine kinase
VSLAARLLFAFGLVAIVAAALVGLRLRDGAREIIEADFAARIEAAHTGVRQELAWEAKSLKGLLAPQCEHDTLVDKVLVGLEAARGDPMAIDQDRRIAIRYYVPDQADALRLDELTLVTGDGTVLGAREVGRIGTKDKRLAALVKQPADGPPRFRPADGGAAPSLEVHCARTKAGVTVGLVGARKIASILERSKALGVELAAVDPSQPLAVDRGDVEVRTLDVPQVTGLRVVASMSRRDLRSALARMDAALGVAGGTALAFALVIAWVLARSLSRPIVALAKETREVVAGQPRRVRGRGGREIVALADAFNRTIDELTAMRKRLAATERIAARREVARRIAHEIKNPLAPIRAAMETLRRLRLRDDPAFDEYFEEATKTVLDEVHRIANIVTEFTRFERLPAPNPEPIDLVAVARGVVTLHASATDGERRDRPAVVLEAEAVPMVSADRDQMVQVLTNLVQNGLDAASAVRDDPRVTVSLGNLPDDRVRVVVSDNGPGVGADMLPRLFEPYATGKEKGTGLGLAIVQRIVFEHGGEIVHRPGPDGGAVFELWLPVSGPPLLEKPPGERAPGSGRR